MSTCLLILIDINYNLQISLEFAVPNVRPFFHVSNISSYLGSKIWNILPLELKKLTNVDAVNKVLRSDSQEIVSVGRVRITYQI